MGVQAEHAACTQAGRTQCILACLWDAGWGRNACCSFRIWWTSSSLSSSGVVRSPSVTSCRDSLTLISLCLVRMAWREYMHACMMAVADVDADESRHGTHKAPWQGGKAARREGGPRQGALSSDATRSTKRMAGHGTHTPYTHNTRTHTTHAHTHTHTHTHTHA